MADLLTSTRRALLKIMPSAAFAASLPVAAKAENSPVRLTLEQELAAMNNEEQAYYHLKLCAKALKAEFGGNWNFGLSIEHQAGYVVASKS